VTDRPTLRRRLDRFIHRPAVEIAILVLVLVSVGLLLAEGLVARRDPIRPWLMLASDVLTAIFAVELSLRFWVARKKSRFFRRYWIDLLALLPLVRPLRMFRVVGVLRVYRAGILLHRRIPLADDAFRQSASQATSLAATSFALVVLAASTLRWVEPSLRDFDDALWFTVFSLIGGEPIYGEPTSAYGRLIALLVMMGGLTLFGVFVGIVSAGMVARLTQGVQMAELDLDELEHHLIVFGWNRAGVQLLRELFALPETFAHGLVLVTEGPLPDDLPHDDIELSHFHHFQGDYKRIEVLEHVGVKRAAKAILLSDRQTPRSDQDRDARTVLAALTIERLSPAIYTVAEVHNRQAESLLSMAGVEEVVVGDWYAGAVLGSAVRNRGLVHVLDELLTGDVGNAFHSVLVPQHWHDRSVADLHDTLVREHAATLLAIERRGKREVNPPPDRTLESGDRIVVVAKQRPGL
jgi:voltage-gated potassium channel